MEKISDEALRTIISEMAGMYKILEEQKEQCDLNVQAVILQWMESLDGELPDEDYLRAMKQLAKGVASDKVEKFRKNAGNLLAVVTTYKPPAQGELF